jgi:hypothetical protein
MRMTIIVLVNLLLHMSVAWAETPPTQEEIARWKKNTQALETAPCKMVTWILENEPQKDGEQKVHQSLGWWGRGFIEGAAYTIDLPGNEGKAMKAVVDFGLSVDIVAAHIAAYCRSNPTKTPIDGVQALLLKALK